MTMITDDDMRQMMTMTKAYSVVILKAGPNFGGPGAEKIIWEHGRRNFALRAEGSLLIVCPITDGSEVKGIGIFATDVDGTRRIMAGDTGVKEGIFVYDVHPGRSFPGDCLS